MDILALIVSGLSALGVLIGALVGWRALQAQNKAHADGLAAAERRFKEETDLLREGLEEARRQWNESGATIYVRNGSRSGGYDRRADTWWVEVGNRGRMATSITEVSLVDGGGGYETSLLDVCGVERGRRIEPGDQFRLEGTRGQLEEHGFSSATGDRWWPDAVVIVRTGDGETGYWANDGREQPERHFV